MTPSSPTLRLDRGRPAVTLVTHFPSPYQVEFFNAIAATGQVALRVIYLHAGSPERQWAPAKITHDSVSLDGPQSVPRHADQFVDDSELVIFNYYRHPEALRWLQRRANTGKALAFWGERLGFSAARLLGRIYRRWSLRALHRAAASIWGIGQWAVESYQAEFGSARRYQNLPYFSDLERFQNVVGAEAETARKTDAPITFLYSGSLIERKGVDLLARAFRRMAAEEPRARLRILGDGPLKAALERELAPVATAVEFLGFKDWEELPRWYAGADFLCAPSRHDGWGLIVPEALAAGLPVISTDRAGAAVEFVRTGLNGWLIGAGSEDALFHALREAVNVTPARHTEMKRFARDSVAEHSLAKGAGRFVAACRDSIESWRP